MSEVLAIKISDGRWFCGWHYYGWKQGKEAMFSEHAPKCYDPVEMLAEFERDFELLKKRRHSPTKRAPDLWESAPFQALSTDGENPAPEVLSTPPTSG